MLLKIIEQSEFKLRLDLRRGGVFVLPEGFDQSPGQLSMALLGGWREDAFIQQLTPFKIFIFKVIHGTHLSSLFYFKRSNPDEAAKAPTAAVLIGGGVG
jgi:hypothetical protein